MEAEIKWRLCGGKGLQIDAVRIDLSWFLLAFRFGFNLGPTLIGFDPEQCFDGGRRGVLEALAWRGEDGLGLGMPIPLVRAR